VQVSAGLNAGKHDLFFFHISVSPLSARPHAGGQ